MTEVSKPATPRRPQRPQRPKPTAEAGSVGVLTAEVAVVPARTVEYLFGGTGTVFLSGWLIPSSFKGPRAQWRSERLSIVGYAKVDNGRFFSGILPLVVPDNGEAVFDLDEYVARIYDAQYATESAEGADPLRALLERVYASDANGVVVPLEGRVTDFDDAAAVRDAVLAALPDYDPAEGTPFEIEYIVSPARV